MIVSEEEQYPLGSPQGHPEPGHFTVMGHSVFVGSWNEHLYLGGLGASSDWVA